MSRWMTISFTVMAALFCRLSPAEERSADVTTRVDITDSSFNLYVNHDLLEQAVSKLEPALLADMALQISAGERVLSRPHAKIPAKTVFDLALKLAAKKGDTATIDRLGRAAQRDKNDGLAKRIAAIGKTAGVSRRANPGFTIPVEETSTDLYTFLRSMESRIDMAYAADDTRSLDQIQTEVAENSNLTAAIRKRVMKLIAETRKIMLGPAIDEPGSGLLHKLMANSRGVGLLGVHLYPGRDGMEVTSVVAGTPAEDLPLQVGDVFYTIDGESMESYEAIKRRIWNSQADSPLLLVVLTEHGPWHVDVIINPSPTGGPPIEVMLQALDPRPVEGASTAIAQNYLSDPSRCVIPNPVRVLPGSGNIARRPSTWGPGSGANGADPITWGSGRSMNGADPRTWGPGRGNKVGGDPSTWAPSDTPNRVNPGVVDPGPGGFDGGSYNVGGRYGR